MIEELRSQSIVAAAFNGDAGAVQRLIEAGTDIETRDGDDDTPLLAAAGKGHLEIVRYLLGRGADCRATNKYGRTALIRAAQSGNLAVAETLLRVDAKVNLGDKERKTPLMMAAAKGGIDIVKLLIEHGALIEAQDKDDFNALLYAVNFGQVDTTKYLLEHYAEQLLGGVDLNNLLSAALNAPSSNCAAEMAEECAILLLRAIGSRAASILVAATGERGPYKVPLLSWVIGTKKYSKNLIKTVLAWGANPNAEYVFGKIKYQSMLSAAYWSDYPDAVEALVETGAISDPHIKDYFILAIMSKNEATITALLNGGADITLVDKYFWKLIIEIVTEGKIFRESLGLAMPKFTLTTAVARHMNELAIFRALRFKEQQIIEYFEGQLPKPGARLDQAYLPKLGALLADAPSATTKYADEMRKIVVAAHVGSAKRIEDEKRGLRRAINEFAKILARHFDWYEDSEEAIGFSEYLLASIDYRDAVRAGREVVADETATTEIGMAFEKICQSVLTESGFAVATTAISGDQGADLIGTKDGLTYVVQCKAWSGSVGNSAVQEAISARSFYAADFAAVVSDGRFTTSARELAARSHVVLIRADGLKMLDVICKAMA